MRPSLEHRHLLVICFLGLSFYLVTQFSESLDSSELHETASDGDKISVASSSSPTRLPLHNVPNSKKYSPMNCGTWQEKYAAYHRDVMAGNLPPRFLVMSHRTGEGIGGYGDRMLGIVSALLVAIATDRAFLLHPSLFPGVNINEFFTSSWIDWDFNNRPSNFDKLQSVDYDFLNPEVKNRQDINPHDVVMNDTRPVIFYNSNRGIILRLKKIPAGQMLYKRLGMLPDVTFSCLHDYLFTPSEAILNRTKPYLDIMNAPNTISMCMQVRCSDACMGVVNDAFQKTKKFSYLLRIFLRKYVECYKSLRGYHPSTQESVLLLTDNNDIRQYMNSIFGSKLLTFTGDASQAKHIAKTSDPNILRNLYETVIGEQYLFQHACNYHLITGESSYGRIGVQLAARNNTVFPFFFRGEVYCYPSQENRLDALADVWSSM